MPQSNRRWIIVGWQRKLYRPSIRNVSMYPFQQPPPFSSGAAFAAVATCTTLRKESHFGHHYAIWRINCENGNFGSSFSQMSKYRFVAYLCGACYYICIEKERSTYCLLKSRTLCNVCCVVFSVRKSCHSFRLHDFITYFTIPSYLLSFTTLLYAFLYAIVYVSNFFFIG